MRNFFKYIIIARLVLFAVTTSAQPGFYVPQAGKIFFNGDSATIFSNVMNYGQLGVGKKAFVNFSGNIWFNDAKSLITDESNSGNGVTGTGGWIRFLSDSILQQLNGGYNTATKYGPLFSHLQIQNKYGVELNGSSAKVRKELLFSIGRVYLRDNMMTVGDNDPGTISGYDSLRYFVTNNKPGSGMLIRENITNSDGRIDFPVGSRDNAYTPAAVQSNSDLGDDYYVNVFDSVKAGRLTGNNLATTGINKTWEIGKRFRPGLDDAEIFLQHLNKDEGAQFTANRNYTYVSYFNGSNWDTGAPQSRPVAGYLTTGGTLNGSGVNGRVFNNTIASPSYFTKFAGDGSINLQTGLWFNARRTGDSTVYVYWKTKPEIDVQYFIVQRKLSNESEFTNVDTVSSLAIAGISFSELDYSLTDPNGYTGISYYRLQVINYNSSFFYSNTIAVGGIPGRSLNLIWPNPTQNIFYVSCDPVWQIESIIVYDAVGRKIKQENTNGRTIIQMGGLEPGTYMVTLVRTGGQIVETKKLVVVGY